MKKIISFTLILSIIFSYLTFPVNKANATMVTDLGNIFQSTISAISNVAQEALDLSDNYKEMVLDPMVNGLAKMIVQQITASIVQWINSGFEGSPSFMQDPGSFFLDIADQATGRFITGDILKSMCSPFSINIKLALLLTYRPRTLKRYTCTIGTIIKNSKNAIKNASINGFTAGDFKQGGWPAFVSLTTEPQNNIYGSYLQAKYDLAVQIADQKDKKNDEINRGRGFLSWRDPKCKKEIAAAKKIEAQNNSAVYDPKTDTYINNPSGSISSTGGEVTSKASMSPDDCPIQTPGSVIAGALDKQLGSGTDQLNLADEFGEIVNALFAQLVSVVIGGSGLGGSSQRNSSGNSYISTMNEDLGRGATELNGQKKSLIDAVKLSKTV